MRNVPKPIKLNGLLNHSSIAPRLDYLFFCPFHFFSDSRRLKSDITNIGNVSTDPVQFPLSKTHWTVLSDSISDFSHRVFRSETQIQRISRHARPENEEDTPQQPDFVFQ